MNKKMQAYWAKHDQWIKERDEVILSFDAEKFKEHYKKWYKEGVYAFPLPTDDFIIAASMRQAVLGLKDPPKDKAEEARKWLADHGMNPDPWR